MDFVMPGVIPGMTKSERKPMNAWDHPLIKKGMEAQLAKRRARIAVIRRVLQSLPYADRDLDAIGKADKKIIGEGAGFLKA